jgi:hypothetical protein
VKGYVNCGGLYINDIPVGRWPNVSKKMIEQAAIRADILGDINIVMEKDPDRIKKFGIWNIWISENVLDYNTVRVADFWRILKNMWKTGQGEEDLNLEDLKERKSYKLVNPYIEL